MQISATPDRLTITATGLRNLTIGLAILGFLALQWWLMPGGLATVVFAVGAAVAGLITLSAIGRFRLEADRVTGLLILSHKTPIGGGSQTLPLATLAGAEVTSRRSSGSSPNYRCEVVLATGARWPLGRAFGAAAQARAAADAINAWVASEAARKA